MGLIYLLCHFAANNHSVASDSFVTASGCVMGPITKHRITQRVGFASLHTCMQAVRYVSVNLIAADYTF